MDLAPSQPAPAADCGRTWTGVLRQIWWTSIPVWSAGLLSFVPFVRLAFGRRRRRDWAIAAAYLAAAAALTAVISAPVQGAAAVAGGVLVLGLTGTAAVHTAVEFSPARSGVVPPAASGQPGNRRAIEGARDRMRRREEGRDLARADPALARELGIGRPDLPRNYDDGGLVDINHAPGHILAAHLGLAPDEVTAVLAARGKLGALASADELTAYDALPPERTEELRHLMIFL